MFRRYLKGRGAARLVVITRALADDLSREFGAPSSGRLNRLTLIAPDGVDLERYQDIPEPRAARKILLERNFMDSPIPEGRFTAGYTGHLYQGRGVNQMLKMASRLPDITFLIIGGEAEQISQLRSTAASMDLKNVSVVGFIPNAELPLYQAACEALMMPYQDRVAASSGGDISRYLSPMKLFEYMACGRVILASDLPVLKEVLNAQNAILLPPDDIHEWVSALKRLQSHPERLKALASQARSDANNYSWEQTRRTYIGWSIRLFNSEPTFIMTADNSKRRASFIYDWRFWALIVLAALVVSFSLARISTGSVSIRVWISFTIVIALCTGLLILCCWLLREENLPGWLGYLLIAAVVLRLLAGVFWFTALPVFGHGSPEEMGGYVMADAAKRDQGAFELAQSDDPLWNSFSNNRKIDQYGGMLFFSGLVYRYLGGSQHNPLLIVVFTAFGSALAVLFLWAFSKRAWGDQEAKVGALILTCYPEAILLGSTQMREAFTMTLTMAAFFGLIFFFQERKWGGLVWLLLSLVSGVILSPPYAALLFGMLLIAALPLRNLIPEDQQIPGKSIALTISIAAVCILAGLWWGLGQFAPEGMTNPISVLGWWVRKSTGLQAHITRLDSGWTQQAFRLAPGWAHAPMLLIYGTLQPFLPAALAAGSHANIWRLIAIWRAAGWILLLPLLVYAPFRAFKKRDKETFTLVLCLLVWAGILAASIRGGGDLWDNPRYRSAFIGLQVGVAAWTLAANRRTHDPWLCRIYISILIVLAWFIPWYLYRYYSFPWLIEDLFTTAALGILTSLWYLIWDWKHVDRQKHG